MKTKNLNATELNAILKRTENAKVCAVGDICLDLYLYADMKQSILSRETPHYPLPIVKEISSPGGGGTVLANMAALGAQVLPVSVIGNDWRGWLLTNALTEKGVDTARLVRADSFITPAYVKPMRMGISDVVYEDPRLDFENRAHMDAETEKTLLSALEEAAENADAVAVADQMDQGIITDAVREKLFEIARKKPVIVDSRSKLPLYFGHNIILKPNEVEAARALGVEAPADMDGFEALVRRLAEKNGAPVLMTIGDKGALWCDGNGPMLAPAVPAEPPIDIVGCGDTFLSAFTCALAVGAEPAMAAAFGCIASAVTVKKIGTTGTASPAEIIAKFKEYEK